MKPLIGLTPTPETQVQEHGTFRLHTLNEHYSQAVINAGGIPVVLPSNNTEITALLDRLDAVIITGGGDIDPKHYNQEKHPKTDEIDKERDSFELEIVHEAISRDMPLLGICRGLQMLNVALGGTLHQDVPDLVSNAQQHKQQDEKVAFDKTYQTAILEDGENPLRSLHSGKTVDVNTFHHQCIGKLAPELQIMASTEDGVIEAVYNPSMTFGMAVQWHPELLAQSHTEHQAIFGALVEAANAYQTRRSNREVPELV